MVPHGVIFVLFLAIQSVVFSEGAVVSSPDNYNALRQGYFYRYQCMIQCYADVYNLQYITGDLCKATVKVYPSDWEPVPFEKVVQSIECITIKCRSTIPPPVCGGSYYFSNDENGGWGSGSDQSDAQSSNGDFKGNQNTNSQNQAGGSQNQPSNKSGSYNSDNGSGGSASSSSSSAESYAGNAGRQNGSNKSQKGSGRSDRQIGTAYWNALTKIAKNSNGRTDAAKEAKLPSSMSMKKGGKNIMAGLDQSTSFETTTNIDSTTDSTTQSTTTTESTTTDDYYYYYSDSTSDYATDETCDDYSSSTDYTSSTDFSSTTESSSTTDYVDYYYPTDYYYYGSYSNSNATANSKSNSEQNKNNGGYKQGQQIDKKDKNSGDNQGGNRYSLANNNQNPARSTYQNYPIIYKQSYLPANKRLPVNIQQPSQNNNPPQDGYPLPNNNQNPDQSTDQYSSQVNNQYYLPANKRLPVNIQQPSQNNNPSQGDYNLPNDNQNPAQSTGQYSSQNYNQYYVSANNQNNNAPYRRQNPQNNAPMYQQNFGQPYNPYYSGAQAISNVYSGPQQMQQYPAAAEVSQWNQNGPPYNGPPSRNQGPQFILPPLLFNRPETGASSYPGADTVPPIAPSTGQSRTGQGSKSEANTYSAASSSLTGSEAYSLANSQSGASQSQQDPSKVLEIIFGKDKFFFDGINWKIVEDQ